MEIVYVVQMSVCVVCNNDSFRTFRDTSGSVEGKFSLN